MRVSDVLTVVERLPSKRPQKRNNIMDGKTEELAAVRVDPPDPGIGRIHTHIYKHALYGRYTIRAPNNPKIKHNVSIILYSIMVIKPTCLQR